MMNKTLLLAFLLLGSMSFHAIDYLNLFNGQVYVKENYVLVDNAGLRKVVIPFHYNKSTTDFDPKLAMRIDPRKVREIEYVYYENHNKSHQEKLNSERVAQFISLIGPKLRNVDGSAFSTVILSNEHKNRTQFTGFIVTLELSSRDNRLLMESMMMGDCSKEKSATFTLDTLSEYGYVLPHLHHNLKADELNVISEVFKRNDLWKNMLIVVDVTGSMTPYLSQYLLWLKLNFNSREVQNYVFFNDGNDTKRSGKKVVGSTGGLYFTQNSYGYSKIEKTIKMAMANGNGGDCPENNIEALIAGEKKYAASNDVVLIADNNATPRDLELVKKLKKPVHIILCGVHSVMNVDYLNLAYKTKGSVHTIESDLDNLIKKKDGETFFFMGEAFYIHQGEIIRYIDKEDI